MKKILLLILCPFALFAQDDLLSEIDSVATNVKVESAFKGLKIVNIESTKLAAKGDLYFIVAHRFGSVKDGFKGFFGLDNAVTQLKFVYGVNDWLTVSGARSEVVYDFSAKYSLQPQIKDGFPVSIVGFSSIGINNLLDESIYPKLEFNNRMIYVSQVLVSRKFNNKLSLQLAPTFFHENFVVDDNQDNSQFALGMGGRYKLSNRWSLNVDYAAHLNRASTSPYKNPLSVGVDLETGGHVFQMHFSSSQGIHESGFLGNTTGDWSKGQVFFGFNLLRVF
ncbi:DUF5777 family beta-barrel protein [Flavobacterium sp.]|uniref:DUF5777 family beta-barrel protein n=1 Tax=Flavobacterium sp. TaxID=239 RepID=UPI002628DA47|nr:DUF5777 family beta-barrel protein [Flavobacterium sp.]